MNTVSIKILADRKMAFRLVIAVLICLWILPAQTASALTYAAPHSLSNNQSLAVGTIVMIDSSGAVRPARQDEGRYVTGCVAALPKGSTPPGKVGIASSGIVSVLVSTLDGDITAGDPIELSSIEGVGMKVRGSGWIVGTAQTGLTDTSPGAASQQMTTNSGKVVTVHVKAIPLLLSVAYYNTTTTHSSQLMEPIQKAVDTIAGHPVSPDRAFLALLIFGISMILLVAMVYSAVRSSLLSIGRNPLASDKISKNLTKVLIIALIAIIMTLIIIYLILR